MDSFTIVLHRAQRQLVVPSGNTILETLQVAGFVVPNSCGAGTCGACKVKVVEGVPDHYDVVLRHDERDDRIMVCWSGSKTPRLVLDL
jgi:tetrachlorobenzoquinone reductase